MGETYRHKWLLEAEDRTKAAFASATQNARGLDKQIAMMMRTAGPGGILGAIGMGTAAGIINREISETADEFDSLAKRAHSLGMLTEELDAMEYAAERARIPNEQLGVAIKTLMRQMTDAARGAGEGRVAFEAMGISVTDGNGRLKSATQMMAEVADKAGNLATAEERAAMMQKLFGESGVSMLGMLGKGADGFRGMVAEGYALGARYEELTTRGEEYKDAQLRLNRALRSTKDAIVAEALPGLTVLAEAISGHVMRAVTGLDDEFRTFLGTMRTLPAEMAMDQMKAKERELLEAVSATNAELEARQAAATRARGAMGAGPVGSHFVTQESRDLLRAGAAANDARTELAALREEMARLQQQVDKAAQVEQYYKDRLRDTEAAATGATAATDEAADSRRNLADATTEMRDAEREVAALLESLRTPQEEYAARTARLYQLMQAGHLTLSQFSELFARLRTEYSATSEVVNEAADDFGSYLEEAENALSATQNAGLAAARSLGDGFSSMIRGQMQSIEEFEAFALDAFQRIADALFQSMVIDKLVGSITKGGGSDVPYPQLGGVPGLPGVPAVGSASKSMGAVPVQITIQAVDTAGAVKVLQQNEPLIVGMVQKAYHRAGKRGPNG